MFFEDMPIPEKYKFEDIDDNLDKIVDLIHKIINNYELHNNDFNLYRNILKNNKSQFSIDVDNLII